MEDKLIVSCRTKKNISKPKAYYHRVAVVLFAIAVILSIFSQIPSPKGEYNLLFLKYCWILPGLYMLLRCPQYIFSKDVRWIWWLSFLFVFYLFVLETFNYPVAYLGTDAFNLVISSLVAIVSYAFWRQNGSDSVYYGLIDITVISISIVALIGYVFILQFVDVGQLQYARIGKNSLGTILLCAVILIMTTFGHLKNGKRIFMSFCLVCLIVVMFLLKSRASLLGLVFVVGYFVIRYTTRKVKLTMLLAFTIAVIAILSIPEYYEVIVKNIIFANRDASNLDSLSSGRVTFLMENVRLIPENLFWGVGARYMDCFPVMQLVQFGFFGALIVAVYLCKVCVFTSVRFKRNNQLYVATFLLFWAFMINSLFEAQAPFGPGVKCFVLWMMFGFSLAEYHNALRNNRVNDNVEKQYATVKNDGSDEIDPIEDRASTGVENIDLNIGLRKQ